jgi:D-tyrosyl-tRNA(Tyr) deacylase
VRVVVQRVARAAVRAADDERSIEHGLVLLAGFTAADDEAVIGWMADKCLALRIFADDAGALNRSVVESGGKLLVVPNFTLYGDARKGRRPSFTRAAPPEQARRLFARFVERLRQGPAAVEAGWFQAHMRVELVNDGPVTLLLERES